MCKNKQRKFYIFSKDKGAFFCCESPPLPSEPPNPPKKIAFPSPPCSILTPVETRKIIAQTVLHLSICGFKGKYPQMACQNLFSHFLFRMYVALVDYASFVMTIFCHLLSTTSILTFVSHCGILNLRHKLILANYQGCIFI